MKKRLLFFWCVVVLLSAKISNAQDVEFSQFYANPVYLNPAFAGAMRCPRVVLNYRNQWPGINNAYNTYNGSYDQHVDFLHGGIGIMVTSDKAGDGSLKTNNFSAVYSYQLPLGR